MKNYNINEVACKYYAVRNGNDSIVVSEHDLARYSNIDAELIGTFECIEDAEELFFNSEY